MGLKNQCKKTVKITKSNILLKYISVVCTYITDTSRLLFTYFSVPKEVELVRDGIGRAALA